jgi:NIMA (never in mitosis gene a)-related kinase
MVKLGDFGISKTLTHTSASAQTVIGTPYYLSPEMVESRPYSFKSDVWALGVLLYEMCTFKPPFDAKSLHALGLRIVSGKYAPIPAQYSNELRALIARLLSVDDRRRPKIREILKFPYISNRICNFLSETVRLDEFSHTVLHNESLFEAA